MHLLDTLIPMQSIKNGATQNIIDSGFLLGEKSKNYKSIQNVKYRLM